MFASWKKSCDKAGQSIKKQRHRLTKVYIVKTVIFPVVMCGFESWTIKKAEHWRIGAFKMQCWRRLLKIPGTAGKSNQSILKESNWIFIGRTDAKAPILWPPDAKSQLIGKDLDAGKDWRQKEKGRQRMRWLDSITNSMDVNFSRLWKMLKDRGGWCATIHESQRVKQDLATEQQQPPPPYLKSMLSHSDLLLFIFFLSVVFLDT